jgi:hypothetical protein
MAHRRSRAEDCQLIGASAAGGQYVALNRHAAPDALPSILAPCGPHAKLPSPLCRSGSPSRQAASRPRAGGSSARLPCVRRPWIERPGSRSHSPRQAVERPAPGGRAAKLTPSASRRAQSLALPPGGSRPHGQAPGDQTSVWPDARRSTRTGLALDAHRPGAKRG